MGYQIIHKDITGYIATCEFQMWFKSKKTKKTSVFIDYDVTVPATALNAKIYSEDDLERAKDVLRHLKEKGLRNLKLVYSNTWEEVQ